MKQLIILLIIFSSINSYAQNNDTSRHESLKIESNNHMHQLIVPAALIIVGTISEINFNPSLDNELFKERNTHIPRFKTKADDFLQYSPILLAYGFDAIGMHSKTDIINRSVILLKSELLMAGTVTVLKHSIRELRPDSSARNSLPSGHTAQAFAAAAFLSEEFGKRYKWVPYLSYSIASTVGALRIMNNKHFLSDVLIGAGIGMLTTKISYWTHQYKWGTKKKLKTYFN